MGIGFKARPCENLIMKLLLTSEGISNPSIAKALAELLGKPFKESRVTYIPTAANGEKGDKGWVEININIIRNLGFLSFDVVDISSVSKDTWRFSFKRADVLVFGGGNVEYLLDWLEKSGVKAALPDLLRTKVYMGISAGSMVTAQIISLTDTDSLYYEKSGHKTSRKGLGFVDFEIRPHLNTSSFPHVELDNLEKLATENPTPFYALDDNSAIKVDGDTVTVVSEGTWKKFN